MKQQDEIVDIKQICTIRSGSPITVDAMGVTPNDTHLVLLNPIVDGLLERDTARPHNEVEAVLVLRLRHRGRRSPTHTAPTTYGAHEITSLAKN